MGLLSGVRVIGNLFRRDFRGSRRSIFSLSFDDLLLETFGIHNFPV